MTLNDLKWLFCVYPAFFRSRSFIAQASTPVVPYLVYSLPTRLRHSRRRSSTISAIYKNGWLRRLLLMIVGDVNSHVVDAVA